MEEENIFDAIEARDHERSLLILDRVVKKATLQGNEESVAYCVEVYPKIVEQWKLGDEQAAALIDVSQVTWEGIKTGSSEVRLQQEQLGRISTLSLLATSLSRLFKGGVGERWPTLPNEGELFKGQTPVDAMIEGGFTRMREVLGYIENLQEQH